MIIGMHGKLRSGKDESFKQLEAIGKAEGIRFKRVAFADPLKEAALQSIGASGVVTPDVLKNYCRITLYKNDAPQMGITGREYLQKFGVAAREVYGDSFWVDQALKNIPHNENVVITDVRFPNEAEAIREAGGYVLYVYRVENEPDGEHVSEKKLPDHLIDFYIDNTKDIQALRDNLKDTLNEILYEYEYIEYDDGTYEEYRTHDRHIRESEKWQ